VTGDCVPVTFTKVNSLGTVITICCMKCDGPLFISLVTLTRYGTGALVVVRDGLIVARKDLSLTVAPAAMPVIPMQVSAVAIAK
jgi:hypothetical protein